MPSVSSVCSVASVKLHISGKQRKKSNEEREIPSLQLQTQVRLTNNNRIWTFVSSIPMKGGIPDEHFWASTYQQGTSYFSTCQNWFKNKGNSREIHNACRSAILETLLDNFRIFLSPLLVCLKASNFGWVNSNNPSTPSKENGAMLISSKNTANATHISRERSFTFDLIYLRFPKAWKLNVMSRFPWSNHFWTYLQHNIPISN